MDWNSGLFVEVNAAYTSQTCSACGHVHKDNRQTQSNFTCAACGGTVSQQAPRVRAASPKKQEPAEEIVDPWVEDSVGIPVL